MSSGRSGTPSPAVKITRKQEQRGEKNRGQAPRVRSAQDAFISYAASRAPVLVLPSIITYDRIVSNIRINLCEKAERLCSALCHKAEEEVGDDRSRDIS